MKNGKEYNGELLSVIDSVMIVFENYCDDVEDSTFSFYSINNKDIKRIEIRGGNLVIFGALIGLIIGSIPGTAVEKAVDNSERKGLGMLISNLIGAIVGGIIGSNTSYYNIVYYYEWQKQFDFTKLNKYARYGSKEPEYLKKIK